MSYLRYLCLFAYSGVQHILCCVFVLFFFVLLSVSMDCPFLIAPSVFSDYLLVFTENNAICWYIFQLYFSNKNVYI